MVSVNALIASIGNAIMIVHTTVNPGKTTIIEKSILIRNVNSIAVNVTLVPKDDLEKIIVMNDKNIVLQPNESVEAKFTIKVSQPGVYEGQIIVLFSGVENNRTSNVALASSITIDAAPANLTGTNNQSYSNNNNQNNNMMDNTANQANNQNNNQNSQNQNSQNNAVKPQSSILIGLIIVVALAIIGLIIFLIILKRQ